MIIYLIIGLIVIFLLIGIILFIFITIKRKDLRIPEGKLMYIDTEEKPGELLSSKTIPLFGKPDYIVRQKDMYIPVEVKTGKTPSSPYKNHIAQLFAYCLLIEENYQVRPTHGVIRYSTQNFIIEYTKGVENHIKGIVEELLLNKKLGKEMYNTINRSKLCFQCRTSVKCKERLL
ncbi:MAG: Dna2/Cas4 domain-containing protein [Patescibacteria group bacterium]|nr:Dna2/Cas4 domain-containing protein [Patescibacteria group bacterium]